MLKIDCDFCGQELKQPGALVFSPPQGELDVCLKQHMCRECYGYFWYVVREGLFNKSIESRPMTDLERQASNDVVDELFGSSSESSPTPPEPPPTKSEVLGQTEGGQ
jgi:hypothetical protein